MQTKIYSIRDHHVLSQLADILQVGVSAVSSYPQWREWYRRVFVPGLKRGERKCIVVRDDKDTIAGFALTKKSNEENKICMLYVREGYRRQGVGTQLMQQALQELGPRPVITVAEPYLPAFKPLLERFHFSLTCEIDGLYRPNQKEYLFNDYQSQKVTCQNQLCMGRVKRVSGVNSRV